MFLTIYGTGWLILMLMCRSETTHFTSIWFSWCRCACILEQLPPYGSWTELLHFNGT